MTKPLNPVKTKKPKKKTLPGNRILLLFDVDQTLISTGGAGIRALTRTFGERYGMDRADRVLHQVRPEGKTDPQIFREILTHLDRSGHVTIATLQERYLHYLGQEMGTPSNASLKPGVRKLLEELRRHPQVLLGLLTGNLREGALIKLTYFHLEHYFEVGAFGSDAEERSALVPIARYRAESRCGVRFSPRQVLVIGDTPLDIACAHATGAISVAVATGSSTTEGLARHQPDHLFNDLSNVGRVVQTLLAHSHG